MPPLLLGLGSLRRPSGPNASVKLVVHGRPAGCWRQAPAALEWVRERSQATNKLVPRRQVATRGVPAWSLRPFLAEREAIDHFL